MHIANVTSPYVVSLRLAFPSPLRKALCRLLAPAPQTQVGDAHSKEGEGAQPLSV